MQSIRRKTWTNWVRRIGAFGFLFFFAKGLVWLALAAGLYMAAQ